MPRLFDTISLGKLRLKNRIVMPPMATNKATSDGEVTESQIKHYAERTKDVGLIIAEHSYVTLSGKLSPNQMGIYDDKLIAGLSKLAKVVHRHRTPIAVQINHAGARTMASVIGAQPLGPHPRRTGSNCQKVKKLRLFRKIRSSRNVIPKPGLDLHVSAPENFPENFGQKLPLCAMIREVT